MLPAFAGMTGNDQGGRDACADLRDARAPKARGNDQGGSTACPARPPEGSRLLHGKAIPRTIRRGPARLKPGAGCKSRHGASQERGRPVRSGSQIRDRRLARLQSPGTPDHGNGAFRRDGAYRRDAGVPSQARNPLFGLGTGALRSTRLARAGDVAAISRIGESSYELRLYRRNTPVGEQLAAHAVNFIGHRGKRYGFVSNDEFRDTAGVRFARA